MKKLPACSSICALLTAVFFFMPVAADAATLYMSTTPGVVSTGDTIVVPVYLDTDTAPANALDGTVSLALGTPPAFSVQTISLASSILTLWPVSPAVSADGTSIRFTGGLPGGFTGSHLLLFTMVLTATAPGTATFAPTSAVLYLNDGKGTGTPVTLKPLSIAVVPAKAGATPHNEWQPTVSSDTTPPEPFTIYLGQDPSVHDGKKYIYFQTTDAQTGVDHYMVQEGNTAPVPSGSTYVLKNQNAAETITAYAYDKAGNVRTSVYTMSKTTALPITPVAAVILALVAALLLVISSIVRRKRTT